MKKITTEEVENILNPRKESESVRAEKIKHVFEKLDQQNNYSFQFKSTRQYWGDESWEKVARDVTKEINRHD